MNLLSFWGEDQILLDCNDNNNNTTTSVWNILQQSFVTSGTAMYQTWKWCQIIILVTFVVSTCTKNYSQVDKLWSIVPWIYAWRLVIDERTLCMAIVSTIWGLRLTYNFSRRDGYGTLLLPWSGEEDYRWSYLQSGGYGQIFTKSWFWILFNLIFISAYQNVLLWLLTVPASSIAYVVAIQPECFGGGGGSSSTSTEWNVWDMIAGFGMLLLILLETLADNQQYSFQTEKYRQRAAKEKLIGDYARGFCTSGWYAIVRKPNYLCEQSIWICYYLFSIAALYQVNGNIIHANIIVNAACIGPVLLILLFQGSGHLTEQITASKYPDYHKYKQQVPLYVPSPLHVLQVLQRGGASSFDSVENHTKQK